MFRRRRPIARAAMVGGAAYYTGKHVQQGREREAEQEYRIQELEGQQQQPAPAPATAAPGGVSSDAIEQLKQLAELKDQGVLTQEEFDIQKRRLLGTA
jgi:BMFP domain-containing protein YqiC